MILYILRALFVLLMAGVGWYYLGTPNWMPLPVALLVAFGFVTIDWVSPRRKLSIFAGTFFGLLVGIAMAYALSFITQLVVDRFAAPYLGTSREKIEQFVNLMIGIVCCYLAISFILQTKDDFRFIIPYVEFSKQTKGSKPILVDTSVLIDGRIIEIAMTGLIESQLVVTNFVVDELQAVADSADRLKRNRGRRGLDILAKLRKVERAEVVLYETTRTADVGVDQQLVMLAKAIHARILTNDFNLNKVAQLQSVDVINLNDLATALRPAVVPGEKMRVEIVKPGEEAGQGVGYLDDGTMVVVEQARSAMGRQIEFVVTRSLQTSAGRMIFGKAMNGQMAEAQGA
jgi:uncharacterized protein YacL